MREESTDDVKVILHQYLGRIEVNSSSIVYPKIKLKGIWRFQPFPCGDYEFLLLDGSAFIDWSLAKGFAIE